MERRIVGECGVNGTLRHSPVRTSAEAVLRDIEARIVEIEAELVELRTARRVLGDIYGLDHQPDLPDPSKIMRKGRKWTAKQRSRQSQKMTEYHRKRRE